EDPAHEHADLRFVLATGQPEAVRPERPQALLRWLPVPRVPELTSEANVLECALASLDKPKPVMFDAFAGAMEGKYPDRLDLDQPWIFSNAGGAMIQMKLYYASIYEYIMIWGTPIGSEGHSGRHAVGFWDTVIDGEMWYYGEGQFDKRVYRPGDRVY